MALFLIGLILGGITGALIMAVLIGGMQLPELR